MTAFVRDGEYFRSWLTQSLNHSICQSLNHSITQSLNQRDTYGQHNHGPKGPYSEQASVHPHHAGSYYWRGSGDYCDCHWYGFTSGGGRIHAEDGDEHPYRNDRPA